MATLETQYKNYCYTMPSPELTFEEWKIKLGESIKQGLENMVVTTSDEFNWKYFKYIEEGHYGLSLDNIEAVKYLDDKFKEFIKIPNFKFSQIKSKFNSFRFYADELTVEQTSEVEKKLKEIYDKRN